METITIAKCPLCQKTHTYSLEVERSYVMKNITMNMPPSPIRTVTYTRLFNCPIKNENFQANIVLHESFDNKIKSVTVKGIENE
jgi:hypothetical protein